jgi:hypothetical protein
MTDMSVRQMRRSRAIASLAAAAALFPLALPIRAQTPAQAPANAAAAATEATAAEWVPKEARFVYLGVTTHYSCDGLRDKVRRALLDLGARPDLSVRQLACPSPAGRPDAFPGVLIKMQVLKPADATAAVQPVPAQWKSVDLKLDRGTLAQAGDCELLEQIKQSLLPLFTTRNVEHRSTCVPHQLSPGASWLRAEILVSAAPPSAPIAAAAR